MPRFVRDNVTIQTQEESRGRNPASKKLWVRFVLYTYIHTHIYRVGCLHQVLRIYEEGVSSLFYLHTNLLRDWKGKRESLVDCMYLHEVLYITLFMYISRCLCIYTRYSCIYHVVYVYIMLFMYIYTLFMYTYTHIYTERERERELSWQSARIALLYVIYVYVHVIYLYLHR